jgi:acyl-coenzyme A synthetase/AMP-(fatty) acid ligase
LGEIEAAANSVDKVKSCACVYLKSCERLVLLYEGGPKDSAAVLSAVKAKVPGYMIPDQILRRKDMPKNANGKIDRKELTRELEELAQQEA